MKNRFIIVTIVLALLLSMTTMAQTTSSNEQADITKGTVRVKIETRLGDIVVRLYDGRKGIMTARCFTVSSRTL